VGGEGDAAFEVLFYQVYPRAVRMAARIVADSATAEDVAAEAMARAYARWSHVHRLAHPEAWVLRVTANLAIDHARRGRPSLPSEAVQPGPEEATTLRLALIQALARLPRRQREAIALRYLTGWSEAEIAEALQVSPGTVKTSVHRGMKKLRRDLGEDLQEVTVDI
jgi:RNA polymerase sigma-70 factor (ECF subfamily)